MRPELRPRRVLAALVLALAAGAGTAADRAFTHKDWTLACDNTGTCRAVGYQREDGDDVPVAVLLQRAAGPGAKVEAHVQFGDYGDDVPQPSGAVRLTVGGRPAGSVEDTFTEAQVGALLKALAGQGEIVFASGKTRWRLSSEGAAAVLLRMDDVQGRLGTPGALVRKGTRPEASVPGPVAAPVVQAVKVADARTQDEPLAAKVFAARPKSDECPEADDPAQAANYHDGPPALWRLGGGRVLVGRVCSHGAYNEASSWWIANDRPPYDPRLVTDSANEFEPATGELTGSMKGRGLGDCWWSASWIWNGREFVHASESGTGLCRLVSAGGTWDMPTIVSDVRKPK